MTVLRHFAFHGKKTQCLYLILFLYLKLCLILHSSFYRNSNDVSSGKWTS